MADEDEQGAPYVWTSGAPLKEGDEPDTAAYVKEPGKAKITYPNGDTFEGTFNEAKQKHGPGKYVWSLEVGEEGPKNAWVPVNEEGDAAALPEGRVVAFEGEYKEGKKHGIGRMTFPNGDEYHGMWENDAPNGDGTYKYSNGDMYSGAWKDGKRHGRGALVYASDDSQLVGTWKQGSIETGKWILKDGTSWHGSFRGNRPFGRGVFYFPNGNMQEGEYAEEAAGDDEEEPDEDEEGGPKKVVWMGGKVVPGSAPAADLLAGPAVGGGAGGAGAIESKEDN